jgi:hypothetical protein
MQNTNIITQYFQNSTNFYKFLAKNTHLGCSTIFDGHLSSIHYFLSIPHFNFLHMQPFASAFSTILTSINTQSRVNSYFHANSTSNPPRGYFYHQIEPQEHKTQPCYLLRTPKVQDSSSNLTSRAGIRNPCFSQAQMAMVKGLGLGFLLISRFYLFKTSFPHAHFSPSSPKHPIAAPKFISSPKPS